VSRATACRFSPRREGGRGESLVHVGTSRISSNITPIAVSVRRAARSGRPRHWLRFPGQCPRRRAGSQDRARDQMPAQAGFGCLSIWASGTPISLARSTTISRSRRNRARWPCAGGGRLRIAEQQQERRGCPACDAQDTPFSNRPRRRVVRRWRRLAGGEGRAGFRAAVFQTTTESAALPPLARAPEGGGRGPFKDSPITRVASCSSAQSILSAWWW